MLPAVGKPIGPREDRDCVVGPSGVGKVSVGQVERVLLSILGEVISEHVGEVVEVRIH